MLLKNGFTLMLAALALVVGVAIAPTAMAADSTTTESTDHMMKSDTGMMKGHAMKGDAMKGHAMKGDAMKGDAMKGDAMKSKPPAQ